MDSRFGENLPSVLYSQVARAEPGTAHIAKSSTTRRYTKQHITAKKRKHEPTETIVVVQAWVKSAWARKKAPLPMNAYELETEPTPDGGVTAKLTIRMPSGACLCVRQLGQSGKQFATVREARKALYQEAFGLELAKLIQSYDPPAPPEQTKSVPRRAPRADVTNRPQAGRVPSSSTLLVPVAPIVNHSRIPRPQPSAEFVQRRLLFSGPSFVESGNPPQVSLAGAGPSGTEAGKKRAFPDDDGAEPEPKRRKEMHGRSYRSMLSAHCTQSDLLQPAITYRARMIDGESTVPPLYDVSALVGTEEFHLPKTYESVEVAEEKLSKAILKSFGIHPRKE